MAIVHQYIIIYITLVNHETISNSINSDLCLETAVRFIENQYKCYFSVWRAENILQDVTTCPNKCKFQIDYLYGNRNSLREIDLNIGIWKKMFHPCSTNDYTVDRYLNINCSSWNAREYIIWDLEHACSITDAQCVRIYNKCICHCLHGYILVDDQCLKKLDESCELTEQCTQPFSACLQGKCKCINGYSAFDTDSCVQDNVPVGGFCSLHVQCTGSNNSEICENGRCICAEGFKFLEFACKKKNLRLNDPCELAEQCIQPFSVCSQEKCKCMNGYAAFDTESCLKDNVPVGGFCSLDKQCTGSNNSGVCENGRCTCAEGFTFIDLACIKRNLELNDSCELTEQCTQPLSVCFQGKCKCVNGYSAFDTDMCLKDTVPVGGFCNVSKQCTGSNNSGICENGRCTCAKEFTSIDLACEKNPPNSLGIGSSNSQQHGTNVGVTLGSLFGGFILGVIVTSVVTTLMYRRLKFRTRKRQEPEFMFAENRKYGTAGGAQISFTNNKKQNVAKLSPYSFSKETQEYNLSRKQEDERTEDVYNHLHEQTEQDNATYDHAFAATNYSADLSDYSNIRDAATVRPTSPSTDGDHYSTLRD